MAKSRVFNFNIGILGHVDSGKTSLAKLLSTTASTAAFDKNPQSQERGITLDLGFSSFCVDISSEEQNFPLSKKDSRFAHFEKIQFTLVDCPGHASLIRSVIGGAQIIDLVILVVDAQKGVQTQTAECLILSEITCPQHMIVVLNKIDLLSDQENILEKNIKRLRKTLENTVFKQAPIVTMSCLKEFTVSATLLENFRKILLDSVYMPDRSESGPFMFAVDHCFSIKGQGTVMTGTVISGSVKVNDTVEIPQMKVTKKLKSIQVFRHPVDTVSQGDRAGLCLAQLEAKDFERGIVSQPGLLKEAYAVLTSLQRVKYFKHKLQSSKTTKYHISIGHETVMATCSFFASSNMPKEEATDFDFDQEYAYVETAYDCDDSSSLQHDQTVYCMLKFDHPILCPPCCLFIGCKLDIDQHSPSCRLAFYGHVMHCFIDRNFEKSIDRLKVFKYKHRKGTVERMVDQYGVIVNGLFKKQTKIDAFLNMKVTLSTGELGYIESAFGQNGNCKVRISGLGLQESTVDSLQQKADSKKKSHSNTKEPAIVVNNKETNFEPNIVELKFKKFIYDNSKKAMVQ